MAEEINTPIEGLKIKIQKVVWDARGVLCELTPQGMEDPFLKAGVKNISPSTSLEKHVHRAAHYHHKNIENFYTLSGVALWVFVDFRENSPTKGKVFDVVIGFDKTDAKNAYQISDNKLAHVLVPNGVYHVFWQLTDKPVTVVSLASQPYTAEDYCKMDPMAIPGVKDVVAKYGIGVS